jgi:hypothetical protein
VIVNLLHPVLVLITLLIFSAPIPSGRARYGYENLVAAYDEILARTASICFCEAPWFIVLSFFLAPDGLVSIKFVFIR